MIYLMGKKDTWLNKKEQNLFLKNALFKSKYLKL